MGRRLGLFAALAAGVVAIALPSGAGAAASHGGCSVSGTANFTPGLLVTKQAVSYTFSGTLSNCAGTNNAKNITHGTVTASGSGSSVGCTGGNTTGSATINWLDKSGATVGSSVYSFKTTGALNEVLVQGTFTSGLFAGQAAKSDLVFTVANPTACNAKVGSPGVTSATFKGASEF